MTIGEAVVLAEYEAYRRRVAARIDPETWVCRNQDKWENPMTASVLVEFVNRHNGARVGYVEIHLNGTYSTDISWS